MKLAFAPAIWLAHFTVVYVLLSLVCATDATELTLLGFRIVPAGVALATAAAVVLIGAVAWPDLHRLRELHAGSDAFLARVSVLLSGVSTLAVGWVAYPAFVLPPCVS